MDDLIVIGAGGFGRETIDIVRAINAVTPRWRLLGVVDDNPSPVNLQRLSALGVPHLGPLSKIPSSMHVAVAVGNPKARQQIVASLTAEAHRFPSLVHPTAILGSKLRHGHGLIVLGGVSIGTNVLLGDHVHVNAGAVIGHDAQCHNFVSVNPNATLSGECNVGTGTLLGASSTVLQQVSIGENSIVGAGACVVHNVNDDQVVKGVPAR